MTAAAPPPASRLKVFVVEDNDDTRRVLVQLLQLMGYDAQAAATVQAAVQQYPASGSRVLLSDLGLPDGDGWQLLQALREAGSAPYAIAMSGFGTPADVARSMASGYRHHLVKPIEWNDLQRLLHQAQDELQATGPA